MAVYSAHANVTATDSLTTRLAINQRYAAFDFHKWVFSHLRFQTGMDVLDVGCGTGVQSLKALEVLKGSGSVTAIDLSKDSVAVLAEEGKPFSNLDTAVGDMAELNTFILNRFRVKEYDLAYSVYALWYSRDHYGVLDAMRTSLRPGGRMVVCTPNAPNGLREVIKRMGIPRPELDQVTNFGANLLEPYFRAYFDDVIIHLRRNVLRITDPEDAVRFYRSTGYYDAAVEARLRRQAQIDVSENGHFAFEKNVYLIEGIAANA